MSFLERLWRRIAAPPVPATAAAAANARGRAAVDAGDDALAERSYLEAIRLDPGSAAAWFNLGLVHKRARRWPEAREANRRALALDPGNEAAAWNLGIAATALADWAEARRAWRAFGVGVPDGEGPLRMNIGPAPIRLPDEEVVWCTRLDPARAEIESVPFPESGRCRGDVVLHDGAPNGYRKLGDVELAVFDELGLLVPSRLSTWVVEAEVADPESAAALASAFERRGLVAEDWTTQVRLLCKACSEGRPHAAGDEHRPASAAVWQRTHRVGIAAESDAPVGEALAAWAAAAPGRSHGPVELGLAAEGRSA